MKSLSSILKTFGLFLLLVASPSYSAPVELIINGEFETPNGSGAWFHPNENNVPGWETTQNIGEFELWNQGSYGSPINGSDGLQTGQHHEVPYSDGNITSQIIDIAQDGYIDFSFDTWQRASTGINYWLTSDASRTLFDLDHIFTSPLNDWEFVTVNDIWVNAGEALTLSFEAIGGGGSGAHIDQVSMMFTTVPEPSIIALMGLGLFGLGLSRRKMKK